MNLEKCYRAYIVAALWSSTDDDGEPLDGMYSIDDISEECKASMLESCKDFIEANASDLAAYGAKMACEQWSAEDRAGHDFWLTRNGHGAGFWDRGLGALGDRLSKAATIYGSVDLYVGDDGLIYGE